MSNLRSIIRRMLYLFRIRRLIKVTLEEYGDVSNEDQRKQEDYYHYPRQNQIYKRFKVFRKKRKAKIFSYVVAIAQTDKYIRVIKYPNTSFTTSISPTIAVMSKGVKFMTPTVFINTLVGSIAPIVSLIISMAAFALSIIALTH